MTINIAKSSIKDLGRALHNKDFSAVELTQHNLSLIQDLDGKFNAFVSLVPEQALAAAKAADERLAKLNLYDWEQQPLLGIPIAHKDIFCTQGVLTSCGSKMLHNFVPPYNATVVEQLAQAGIVMVGKTNMDEFAMGSSGETSYYGLTKNPWNLEYVPGGSSSGSAAAVAAGLVVAATGTDTGGSIRQPAAFCGITGIKPTYGLVSRYGMIAFASSLDQAGPMAKSAEDCALLLQYMVGHDPKDSTSLVAPKGERGYYNSLRQPLVEQNLTIGLVDEFFPDDLDSNIAKILQAAISELQTLGVNFKKVSLPNTKLAIPAYYVIAPAECSSNLARYDGVRFGHRCEQPTSLEDLYERSRTEGFGTEVKRRILLGTNLLSSGYYDAYYTQAQRVRRLITEDFKRVFVEQGVDLLLGPTTPSTAFKFGSKSADPVQMYLNDIYTTSVNLAGLPAMSVPVGLDNGLPVGMQLIGNYFSESLMLNVAHQYQTVTSWHTLTP